MWMRNRKGFTLVEIMIVVAIIGLLAAIAVPNFVTARSTARGSTCINNLRLIAAAKEQYALENNKTTGDAVTATDLDSYLRGGTVKLWCALDDTKLFANSYTINDVGTDPVCQKDGTNHVLPAEGTEDTGTGTGT